MKTLVNSTLFYFLSPICFSLVLFLVFFHVPNNFHLSLFSLFFVLVSMTLLVRTLIPLRMKIDRSFELMLKSKEHRKTISLFCVVVLLSGPLDVYQNGFKLMDPSSYAEFNGIGRYIRNISSLCWTFVPIAFVFPKDIRFKISLIGYALIFPIVILDRNRLFASFYSLALCLVLMPATSANDSVLRASKRRGLLILAGVVCLTFSGLGFFRSGTDAFVVESSGASLMEGELPLRDIFFYLPSLLQQIILYITTPLFNFATISYFDFLNEEFLLSQLSPFGRDSFDAYPYAPVMVQRFNVGTEFYPFLLYGGLPLVALSIAFMGFSFSIAGLLFKRRPNIFTFLIFLKISYAVVFMGFAPQFYLLLNLAFILLMIFLWILSLISNQTKPHLNSSC
jgi:hypothetical protein